MPRLSILRTLCVAGLATSAPAAAAIVSPTDRVHVFAGTSNSRWQLFPGATLPMGMVKLSPDNQGNSWNGGYEYTVGSISGFTHLHAFGLSGLSLMPMVGPLQSDPTSSRLQPGAPDGPFGGMWTAGYRSRIDKASERGAPGYYAVDLIDAGVRAELTATARCGFLRFTFPRSDDAHVLLDFEIPAEEKTDILAVDFVRRSATAFEGHVRQRNQYAGTHDVWFVLESSRPLSGVRTWRNAPYTGTEDNYGTAWRRRSELAALAPAGLHATGSLARNRGVVLDLTTAGHEAVVIRTGLSFVDIEGARANLKAEAAPFGFDFDRVAAHAREIWNARLGAVAVSDENPSRTDTFYTALYRTFAGKAAVNDVDGRYVDHLGHVARLRPPADAVYSADGFWGTQWTLTPLWTLLAPDVATSMANSLLELADRGGWIPEAPTNLRYAPVMVAQHHDALLVSAVQKHLPGVDAKRAYAHIRHDLTTPGVALPDGQYAGDRALTPYLQHGYVPDEAGGASTTFEYAYDDWCAGQLARTLDQRSDALMFSARAASWRNQIDPATGYARRRRADGSWVAPFELSAYGTTGGWNGAGFVEGTAWTYTWWVPQDVPGLVRLIGPARFNERLKEGFETGRVDLTNEPGLQSPFLFNYSGEPWLTQTYTRRIVAEDFDTSPYRGWRGEEDEGQLTAYFVLLSMGLFEIDGGCSTHPAYDLTSPAFRRIALKLASGATVTIESEGAPGDVYIQSASWNGRPLRTPHMSHAALSSGGVLRYVLGPRPSRWGVDR